MHKAKWIRTFSSKTLKEIALLLANSPYDTSKHSGFEMLERSAAHIESQYVERLTDLEEVRDPFGVVTTLETTRYQVIKFRLFESGTDNLDKGLLLQVQSPPRSLRSFIDRLDDLLNGVTIADIDILPLSVFEIIKQGAMYAFVSRIKASDVWLSEHSCARLEIISRNDALSEFRARFGQNDSTIEKVRIERPFDFAGGFLEISRTGTVTHDEASEEMVCHFLLDYLNE